jgi:hypothetical protein
MIDANNPIYSVPLALLEGRFIRLLESRDGTKSLSPEQIALLSHKLAVLRFSQTMFEATIAKVAAKGDSITVAIPEYRKAGDALKAQTFDQVLKGISDPYVRSRIDSMYGFFGGSPQVLEISTQKSDGDEQYVVVHEYLDIRGTGPMKVRSTMAANELGPYSPFIGWLPKS